ncbi:hypothetical protein ACQUJT_13045 [Ralstonia pseudosolanacearum]|nr:hypothetical protein [Ralstonia pseudosolanacearum]UWD91750.1 hypothetical protein NY025_12185 [Ralstonia pseudosolanacearum]CAH0439783.1 hypothetical protein LMG9673_00566 [Ralstonia pseudosolanacearum]
MVLMAIAANLSVFRVSGVRAQRIARAVPHAGQAIPAALAAARR